MNLRILELWERGQKRMAYEHFLDLEYEEKDEFIQHCEDISLIKFILRRIVI